MRAVDDLIIKPFAARNKAYDVGKWDHSSKGQHSHVTNAEMQQIAVKAEV